MRSTPQRRADVPGQAAQVRAAAHRGAEPHIGHRVIHHLQLGDLDATHGRLDQLAASGPAVRPLARDLHGRIRRRTLQVPAPESRQRCRQLPGTHPVRRRRRDDRPRRVVGVGRDAEANDAFVRLRPPTGKRRQPRRPSHHHHQQTLGKGIERSQVTDALNDKSAPHGIHHIVGGRAGRLGNQRYAVRQSSLSCRSRSTVSMRCACSMPRSRWKCSSGLVRSRSWPASWARR